MPVAFDLCRVQYRNRIGLKVMIEGLGQLKCGPVAGQIRMRDLTACVDPRIGAPCGCDGRDVRLKHPQCGFDLTLHRGAATLSVVATVTLLVSFVVVSSFPSPGFDVIA